MKTLSSSLLLTILFSSIFSAVQALSDERILPKARFREMGFRPIAKLRPISDGAKPSEPPQGLPWPITFQDATHTVAQNYVEFQEYGGDAPYFHQGCDLRSPGGSVIVAPVDGVLDGGYYGYTTESDGSMIKQWQAWNGQTHPDAYFELAVITDDGIRYEMHHVDSETLPSATVSALNQGHVWVHAGELLGRVNDWAFPGYSHVHYNIIRSDGVIFNPEYYSVAVADHAAPELHGVFAAYADGSTEPLTSGGTTKKHPAEIIIAVTDRHDPDSTHKDAYVQTPPFTGIRFEAGSNYSWDFRQRLQGPNGGFPDLRKFYDLERISVEGGASLVTSGQFGRGMFLIRLPVETGDHGRFEITIEDMAGNSARFGAAVP